MEQQRSSDFSNLLLDLAYFRESPRIKWTDVKKNSNGSFQLSYPIYGEEVYRLMDSFAAGNFACRDYLRRTESLNSDSKEETAAFIATANIDDLLALLTLYIRGERFCDGMIAGAIESGTIGAILLRIRELT